MALKKRKAKTRFLQLAKEKAPDAVLSFCMPQIQMSIRSKLHLLRCLSKILIYQAFYI
ncbi:hypothetical protein Peur_045076 [Populus x canadensis]